jgi:hypothetical protein
VFIVNNTGSFFLPTWDMNHDYCTLALLNIGGSCFSSSTIQMLEEVKINGCEFA